MENTIENYKFFTNFQCEFYPCHGFEDNNCLFCYCPLYKDLCPFIDRKCEDCKFPHMKGSYNIIIKLLKRRYKNEQISVNSKS